MSPRLGCWLRCRGRTSLSRSGFRVRSRRPHLEELESRLAPSAPPTSPVNVPLTTDPGVQQQPSLAVDPNDSQHVVVAFMDYSLLTTGYAGIGTMVSEDGGASWSKESAIPLPANFDEGAANPIVQFDGQGHVFVTFMAVTFKGPTASALTNGDFEDRGAAGITSDNGIFECVSDDGGMTWHPAGNPDTNADGAIVEHIYDGTNPVDFEVIPDLAIDTFRTLPNGQPNPNYGNQYEVWTRIYVPGLFPGDPNSTGGTDIMVAVSKDHGQTWQIQYVPGTTNETVIQDPLNSIATGASLAPLGLGVQDQAQVTVGPEGDLYVSYITFGDFSVAHSTDAGASFAIPDHQTPEQGTSPLRLPFGNGENITVNEPGFGDGVPNGGDQFRTFPVRDIVADPTRPGSVYAVSTEVIADAEGNQIDPADVLFARSTDYGVTWTSTFQLGSNLDATVLNDDNGGNSATGESTDVTDGQAMPSLAVDPRMGDISVIWYDTRRDPGGQMLDVFGTTSTDGGLTFSPNYRVTTESFDPNLGKFLNPTPQQVGQEVVTVDFATGMPVPATGQYQYNYYLGDRLGLALANNTVYAA
jgi:BNR/Asp-box repeat